MDAALFQAWALTVSVEYVIWMSWFRSRPLVYAGYCILVNTFTQPLAVRGYWLLIEWLAPENIGHHLPSLLIIEIIVPLVEWPLIRMLCECSWKKALLISVTANFVTACMSFMF